MGEGWIDCWTEGQRTSIQAYELSTESRLNLVIRRRHRLDDLELREIQAHEVPDINAFRAALEKIPPDQRLGIVEVPELQSQRPPEPVKIEFGVQPPSSDINQE